MRLPWYYPNFVPVLNQGNKINLKASAGAWSYYLTMSDGFYLMPFARKLSSFLLARFCIIFL